MSLPGAIRVLQAARQRPRRGNMGGSSRASRYDGQDLILTMNDVGTVTGSWTFGPGIEQPLTMNRASVMHYYLADGLGRVRALAHENGDVAQTYEYSVFGQMTEQTGRVENPFTYTVREWEPEVGLYYYRARWYEAGVGRFLAEDSLGWLESDRNRYRYVYNRPVNLRDPLGTDGETYQQGTYRVHAKAGKCVADALNATLATETLIVAACAGGCLYFVEPTAVMGCITTCVVVGTGVNTVANIIRGAKCHKKAMAEMESCRKCPFGGEE